MCLSPDSKRMSSLCYFRFFPNNQEDWRPWMDRFSELDADGSGELDRSDFANSIRVAVGSTSPSSEDRANSPNWNL